MAQLRINPEMLKKTLGNLEEAVGRLRGALERMQAGAIEEFVLTQGPPVNDAIPALIEFAAKVDARLDVIEIEAMYGKSAKTKRDERRGIGVKSKKKTK